MKLSVKDRIIIPGLYPELSNIIEQVLVKDIKEKVDLSQSEFKTIEFRKYGGKYIWDNEKAKDKEVDFTESELNLLRTQIDKMDKEKKITQEILSLCLKIRSVVNGKEQKNNNK